MKIFLRKLKIILPVICLIILFIFPNESITGGKFGLSLWYSTILPMEAKLLDDMASQGLIPLKNADFLMSLFNNASPMFIYGYVYSLFLKDYLNLIEVLGLL